MAGSNLTISIATTAVVARMRTRTTLPYAPTEERGSDSAIEQLPPSPERRLPWVEQWEAWAVLATIVVLIIVWGGMALAAYLRAP